MVSFCDWEKNDQNWDNIGHFWFGNREKFGCKIDQIKTLNTACLGPKKGC